MPSFRIPIRNGPHRIAAIALFRALLTQCRALPSPFELEQRDELQNIIRNRFKQARHSHSTPRLRVQFQAGYEAIDYLDNAVAGHEESLRYVRELLERAPARIKVSPPLPTPKTSKPAEPALQKNNTAQQPKPSIFNRPLPLSQLSGPRRVPVLFSANRIPVLRIKKPQPENLSRYIRQRIEQRQSRNDRRWRLKAEQDLAEREDEWDDIIAGDSESVGGGGAVGPRSLAQAMLGSQAVSTAEPKWTAEIGVAIREVEAQLDEEREKNRAMAEKMQAVVDRERELFEEEKKDRYRAKRREYRYRRRQKDKSEERTAQEDADRAGLLANLTSLE